MPVIWVLYLREQECEDSWGGGGFGLKGVREKKCLGNSDVVFLVTFKASLIRSCTDLQYERA